MKSLLSGMTLTSADVQLSKASHEIDYGTSRTGSGLMVPARYSLHFIQLSRTQVLIGEQSQTRPGMLQGPDGQERD